MMMFWCATWNLYNRFTWVGILFGIVLPEVLRRTPIHEENSWNSLENAETDTQSTHPNTPIVNGAVPDLQLSTSSFFFTPFPLDECIAPRRDSVCDLVAPSRFTSMCVCVSLRWVYIVGQLYFNEHIVPCAFKRKLLYMFMGIHIVNAIALHHSFILSKRMRLGCALQQHAKVDTTRWRFTTTRFPNDIYNTKHTTSHSRSFPHIYAYFHTKDDAVRSTEETLKKWLRIYCGKSEQIMWIFDNPFGK